MGLQNQVLDSFINMRSPRMSDSVFYFAFSYTLPYFNETVLDVLMVSVCILCSTVLLTALLILKKKHNSGLRSLDFKKSTLWFLIATIASFIFIHENPLLFKASLILFVCIVTWFAIVLYMRDKVSVWVQKYNSC